MFVSPIALITAFAGLVSSQISLTVTNPQNVTYVAGSAIDISWDFSGNSTALVGIVVENRDAPIMPFSDKNFLIKDAITTGSRSYRWVIPNVFNSAANYRIRVWGNLNGYSGYSAWFSIFNPDPPSAKFAFTSPSKGQQLSLCSNVTISWVYPLDNTKPANLFVYIISATTKKTIYRLPEARGVNYAAGSYTFLLPDVVPVGNDAYFLGMWKTPTPGSLQPGFYDNSGKNPKVSKFEGNSEIFSVIPSLSGNNTCAPPPENNKKFDPETGNIIEEDDPSSAGTVIPGLAVTIVVALMISRILF